MVIFKYEMRQLRSYTLWWAVASALAIFMLFPIYISLLGNGTVDIGAPEGNPLFDMLGVSANVISTPIGCYGFLTAFFAIAAGICGMYLGLKAFTKETVGKSAEFIYTKPYKRGKIFLAKVLPTVLAAMIIGFSYYAGSMLSALMNTIAVDYKLFSLVALSFMLIELFFVLFGAFVGAVYSKIRTPLLVSSGAAFMFYVLSAFASKVNIAALKYFTPYSYFGTSDIVGRSGYNIGYMTAFVVLCVVFAVAGYTTFVKKDISFIS